MTKLCLALNVGDRDRALDWLGRLGREVDCYKLQMDLFGRAGPGIVHEFVEAGVEVFLDLKFHDIPTVVAAAVRTAGEMGAGLVTVHATGGQKMMEAAARAAREFGEARPRVLGVTVLTSLDQDELGRVFGCSEPLAERVLALARLARDSGCDGVVCSPQEARQVKEACGPEFLAVCPGIRLGEQGGRMKAEGGTGSAEDQARVATPASAARDGADYIVVGRPIYSADDPVAAAREFRRQLEESDE